VTILNWLGVIVSDILVYILGQRDRLLAPTVMQKGNVLSIQCIVRKCWESCIPRCSSPACQNQVPTHTVLWYGSVSN